MRKKRQRTKVFQEQSGERRVNETTESVTEPYTIWHKRPCNRKLRSFHYLMFLMSGKYDCRYFRSELLSEPGDCPIYDARYCPPRNLTDNDI